MERVKGCFVSYILNAPVYDQNDIYLGKVIDIIVTSDEHLPQVEGIKLKNRNNIKEIAFKSLNIFKDNKGYKVIVENYYEYKREKNYYSLSNDILDKQIVDINGKRVVRVNDLRLAEIGDGYKVVAVDIGFRGLLRRLGVLEPCEFVLSKFGKRLSNNLIIWDNVEPIQGQIDRITLSMPYKKLKSLHPADIADILEELDARYRSDIFKTFDARLAANTLEEFEDEYQTDLVENIDASYAKEIFENMPNDEIADILEDVDEEHVEKILEKMDKEDAEEIKELLDYDEDTVGSIMTTDYIAFNENETVDGVIRNLRETKPSSEIAYYLYVIDDAGRLVGVVSLRDLIVADGDAKLKDIMRKNVIYVLDEDNLDDLTELVTKYELLAVPVVDKDRVLVGMAILNDIVDEVLLPRWKKILRRSA
ncbi:magnesium transporter MgtE N-terminal domain-containing protein [Caloramator australicus]|uniref:Magnesium transporter n=1 Tax=Caloramator australicus RC3 TaxID=857293 RepID=I7LJ53_9CLOT|nr:CBS domain-containing protein [Caloramator australicus]CCJ33442.1 Magnesium transporter [Caloramator australicus RC3]